MCSARNMEDLESINASGITRVSNALKSLRLKVNDDKTVYLVIMSAQRRHKEITWRKREKEVLIAVENNGIVEWKPKTGPNTEELLSELKIGEKTVVNKRKGKCLGLVIDDDLTWKSQVMETVKECKKRMHRLWGTTKFLNKEERKEQAEGIIGSKLRYCLEISSGTMEDLKKLQGQQSRLPLACTGRQGRWCRGLSGT